MSNQRRRFLRSISLTSLGTPLLANSIFATSTISSNLNFIDTGSITTKFSCNEISLFNKLSEKGYKILLEEQFSLNKHCKAFPLKKDSLVWGKENKLLLITKNNHFIISEKQQEAYNEFTKNYTYHLTKATNSDINISDFVTPVEILKTNKTGDFRFKNTEGTIIEVHASKKRDFVKVVT